MQLAKDKTKNRWKRNSLGSVSLKRFRLLCKPMKKQLKYKISVLLDFFQSHPADQTEVFDGPTGLMFDTPDLDSNHWNIYARRDCKLKYWHITHNIVYLSFDSSTFSFCINYFICFSAQSMFLKQLLILWNCFFCLICFFGFFCTTFLVFR